MNLYCLYWSRTAYVNSMNIAVVSIDRNRLIDGSLYGEGIHINVVCVI